jgi:hypothetical protein
MLVPAMAPAHQPSDDDLRREKLARERFADVDLSLWRVPINPQVPDTGITTGLVIAYGHPIAPPYVVSTKDSFVFVNGVQISPGLRPPELVRREQRRRDSVPPIRESLQAERDSVKSLQTRAHRLYDSLRLRHGHERALDSVAAMLRASGHVDSLRAGGNALDVDFKGYHRSLLMYFEPDTASRARPPSPWPIIHKSPQQRALSLAAMCRGELGNGWTIVFSTHSYGSVGLHDVAEIKRMLGSDSLSEFERFARLCRIDPCPEWYLANYDPREWTAAVHKED